MRVGYSFQFNCPSIVIEDGDTAEDVIEQAELEKAVYHDGEELCIVADFQNEPNRRVGPEVYTKGSLRRSMK